MKPHLALILLFVLLYTRLIASQNNKRCKHFSQRNSTVISKFCDKYYVENFDDSYYDKDEVPGIKEILNDGLFAGYSNASNDFYQCTELISHYLCHYYFPVCDMDHDEILPVCSFSCNLIFNNEECHNLFTNALDLIVEQNITILPSNESCTATYHPFTGSDKPEVSDFCLDIEVSLNEPIPLNCIESPQDFCSTLLSNTHYAPGTLGININPDDLKSEIKKVRSLQEFTTCTELINILDCIIRYPACNSSSQKLIPMCQSQCLSIEAQIPQCLLHLENNLIMSDFPMVEELLRSVDCDNPESYYNFPSYHIESNSTNCLMIELPSDASSTMDSDIPEDISITIGAVSGIFIMTILFATVLLVILVMKKKKVKLTKEIGVLEYQNSETSLSNKYVSTPRGQSMSQCSINTEGSLLEQHKFSVQLQIDQLLFHVKEKFSEVLLPVETVTKLEMFGKGKFGVVHKGKLVTDNGGVIMVAIKTIKSVSLDGMKDLVSESSIMKTFDHPNVLPLLGVCIDYDDDDVLKIVIPFMPNGDLRNFLKDNRVAPNNTHECPENLSNVMLKRMCFDIAKGMEYLAEKRFIHRDLAARNCMVDKKLSIKVADFGLARDIYSTEYYRMEQHATLPVKWMPLESLMDGYFDEKTDVWSYGVTCWEIFSLGRIPYPGVDNVKIISLLRNGIRLEQPYLCPSDFYEMIKSTWQEEPKERPSFSNIVQFFLEQDIIEVTPMYETDDIMDDNDSGYLDIFSV